MIMRRKYSIAICTLVVLLAGMTTAYYYHLNQKELPTYFDYSIIDKIQLNRLSSNQVITIASLKKWDQITFDLIKKNKVGDAHASRIYANVYTAQRDAAFLSKNVTNQFMGSIEPTTVDVLCLFFVNDCPAIKSQLNPSAHDGYSNKLSELVLRNIKLRLQQDNKQHKSAAEVLPLQDHWVGDKPYYGQDVGSWLPWFIQSGQEYSAPVPPVYGSTDWTNQLDKVHEALKNITKEQITSVVFWAGNPSTVTVPGLWLIVASNYMNKLDVKLEKYLYVRSVLAMGDADSAITVFNSKYKYWVKRPFMLDPLIHTVMPTPNHPSYPAGHATVSSTAAIILTFFFPENQQEWEKLEAVASQGRVWAGIHFPIDIDQGIDLGAKVGDAVLLKTQWSI